VSDKTMIPVEVEVRFRDEDECPGLVRGGFLEYVRYQVELLVPAGSIPDYIEASLKGRDINDTIHISDFDLPEGVEPTITDRDFTVATITAPSGMAEDEEEGEPEEPAEPEVIRQKDEDEDQGEA
jgi:large subunit ribosomal protein L25